MLIYRNIDENLLLVYNYVIVDEFELMERQNGNG